MQSKLNWDDWKKSFRALVLGLNTEKVDVVCAASYLLKIIKKLPMPDDFEPYGMKGIFSRTILCEFPFVYYEIEKGMEPRKEYDDNPYYLLGKVLSEINWEKLRLSSLLLYDKERFDIDGSKETLDSIAKKLEEITT